MDDQSLSTALNQKSTCILAKLEEDVTSVGEYKYMFNDTYSLLKTFALFICNYTTRVLRQTDIWDVLLKSFVVVILIFISFPSEMDVRVS